jgi:hypothetical protein
VDTPVIGGREFPDEVFFDEELDILFAQVAGCEGSYGRSFPFDLDGDILKGLLGHSVGFVVLRLASASYERLRSDRIPEETRR